MTQIQIDGVEIESELGRGSSGIVYRARRGDKLVALKIYHGNSDDIMRLRREVAALAALNHPNITEIYEVGVVDDQPYLLREYISGVTLSTKISNAALPVEIVLNIASEVAEALGAAHIRGMVHCDVKPQNILICENYKRTVLSDFGLVVDIGHSKEFVGTLLYAAPEQTGMLHRPVDARSDLYSLGCVMYECLAGRPVFDAKDPNELIRQHAVVPPIPLQQLNPNLPEAICEIIMRLLAKDPDDRYQLADDLLSDLATLTGRSQHPLREIRSQLFIGREKELKEISAVGKKAIAGHGGICIITGRPGAGRRSLVEQATHGLEKTHRILSTQCTSHDSMPFGALRRAFESWISSFSYRSDAFKQSEITAIKNAGESIASLIGRLSPQLISYFPDVNKLDDSIKLEDQFLDAIVHFLVELSNDKPLVFIVHDIHWLDDASQHIFCRLAAQINSSHIMLIGTASQEEDEYASVEQLLKSTENANILECELNPFSKSESLALLKSLLGGTLPTGDLANTLVTRSNGRPMLLSEYFKTVLKAGLLLPHWGAWQVDPDWRSQVDLPERIVEVVLSRADCLNSRAKNILSCAALIGNIFDIKLIERTLTSEVDESVFESIDAAVKLEVIENVHDSRFRFLHERVRVAYLELLSSDEKIQLHTKIADELLNTTEIDDELTYAIAYHTARGDGVDLSRIFKTSFAAGKLALSAYAHDDAFEYFSQARTAQVEAGLETNLELEELFAKSAALNRNLKEVENCLNELLPRVDDPVRRANIHAELAQTFISRLMYEAAESHTHRALKALDKPMPKKDVAQFFAGIGHHIVGSLSNEKKNTSIVSDQSETLAILSRVYESQLHIAMAHNRAPEILYLIGKWYRTAQELGPSLSLAVVCGYLGVLHGSMHRNNAACKWADHGIEIARKLNDPVALARSISTKGCVLHLIGEGTKSEAQFNVLFSNHAQWLETYDYAISITFLAIELLNRGYVREALKKLESSVERIGAAGGQPEAFFSLISICKSQLAGNIDSAISYVERHEQAIKTYKALDFPVQAAFTLSARNALHIEYNLKEPSLDSLLAQFRLSKRSPATEVVVNRNHYIIQAQACLYRGLEMNSDEVEKWIPNLKWACKLLGQLKGLPVFLAHFHSINAGLLFLQNKISLALDETYKAELLASKYDCPWAKLTALSIRAYLYESTSNVKAAKEEARMAMEIAKALGFSARAKTLAKKFNLEGLTNLAAGYTMHNHAQSNLVENSFTNIRLRRQMDALLQVSLRTATVFEPDKHARAVLDELISLLGAERAFLFDINEGDRILRAGRNAEGESLGDDQVFTNTALNHVQETHKSVLLSAGEEGPISTSESVVANDIRSMIAAPLILREKLIGIVYLDSRIARGMFTEEDAEILVAIANQIAVGMETVRAAQLEVSNASKVRRLAEQAVLLEVSKVTSANLEISKIAEKITSVVSKIIGIKACKIVLINTDSVIFDAPLNHVETDEITSLLQLSSLVIDKQSIWTKLLVSENGLLVPLIYRQRLLGVMGFSSDDIMETEVIDLLRTIALQVSAAVNTARLFEETERLATTDSLTGLVNRAKILSRLAEEISRAFRHQRPMATAIIDIDFFKNVNDTYGHLVGDRVLEIVASSLGEALRASDVVGRYGGEEFIMVLPETNNTVAVDRIRERVANLPITIGDIDLKITVSIGIVFWDCDKSVTSIELLAEADKMLYQAKENGRNKVVSTQMKVKSKLKTG